MARKPKKQTKKTRARKKTKKKSKSLKQDKKQVNKIQIEESHETTKEEIVSFDKLIHSPYVVDLKELQKKKRSARTDLFFLQITHWY